MSENSTPASENRTGRFRMTLTMRTVEALQPEEKSYTPWADKLSGFGVRVQPSSLRLECRDRAIMGDQWSRRLSASDILFHFVGIAETLAEARKIVPVQYVRRARKPSARAPSSCRKGVNSTADHGWDCMTLSGEFGVLPKVHLTLVLHHRCRRFAVATRLAGARSPDDDTSLTNLWDRPSLWTDASLGEIFLWVASS